MPLNLTFDSFEPTIVHSGETIHAECNQAINPPLIPISGVPLGVFFTLKTAKAHGMPQMFAFWTILLGDFQNIHW